MRVPKLNVRLLRRILRHIKADPRRYNQGTWGVEKPAEHGGPPCGTQACIAGWAVLLSVPRRNWLRWISRSDEEMKNGEKSCIRARAKKLLGLTEEEAQYLFGVMEYEHEQGIEGVACAEKNINKLIGSRRKR